MGARYRLAVLCRADDHPASLALTHSLPSATIQGGVYLCIDLPEEGDSEVVDLAGVDSGVAGSTLEAAGCKLAAGEEGTLAVEGWLPVDCMHQH